MIIVRVYGGLGNQLFQINFGHFLHEKFNEKVYFDFSFFKTQGIRKPLVKSILKEINQPPKNITKRFIKFKIFRLNQLYNKIFNKNYFTQFDPKVQIDENQNYFFDGYWQDQKFLTKNSIQFQEVKFSKVAKDYLDQIQLSKNSISIPFLFSVNLQSNAMFSLVHITSKDPSIIFGAAVQLVAALRSANAVCFSSRYRSLRNTSSSVFFVYRFC